MPLLTALLLEPFTLDFFQRALLGGSLVAILCGVVGTWVVIRGMAFLGEALAHGMLPGVALATLFGLPVLVGGAASAVVMSLGIGMLQRRGRLSYDTSIGMLFVAMLALGVVIISHSGSFATDATSILFGDILAISPADLLFLGIAAGVGLLVAAAAHRPLVALALDARVAATLGLGPRSAQAALVGLVSLAVVASYQAVGSLLVVGLLLAPAVAAAHWTTRIPTRMALAAVLGIVAVLGGLLVSWFAATAAGASVAVTAIGIACLSWVLHTAVTGVRSSSAQVGGDAAATSNVTAVRSATSDLAADTSTTSTTSTTSRVTTARSGTSDLAAAPSTTSKSTTARSGTSDLAADPSTTSRSTIARSSVSNLSDATSGTTDIPAAPSTTASTTTTLA